MTRPDLRLCCYDLTSIYLRTATAAGDKPPSGGPGSGTRVTSAPTDLK